MATAREMVKAFWPLSRPPSPSLMSAKVTMTQSVPSPRRDTLTMYLPPLRKSAGFPAVSTSATAFSRVARLPLVPKMLLVR